MSYVPPHKRVSKMEGTPPPMPMPAQMIPQFKKNLYTKNSSRRGSDHKTDRRTSTLNTSLRYAKNSIKRWLAVPSKDNMELLSSLCLVRVSCESIGLKTGDNKQLTLVNGHLQPEHHDITRYDLEHMWEPVVETVHADLMSAFEELRKEVVDQNLEETKPIVVARFGKLLFHRSPSNGLVCGQGDSVSESYKNHPRRVFHANVPLDYIEHVKNVVVPELGVQSKEEKEQYHIKLNDAKRAHGISCKCRVNNYEKRIELDKIELDRLRHVIEDISCLVNNVDLRLALCSKKNLIALKDEEVECIRNLIGLAIFDPDVKGGLKWPLGKTKSGDHQYSVVAVVHIKTEVYSNSCRRLRVREIDRYDFHDMVGEVTREVSLALTDLTKYLLEQQCDTGSTKAMLEDALKLIQNHFLAWDGTLVSCNES